MLLFRSWLRANDADREAYLEVKRDLDQRTWRHAPHHADAKATIVAGRFASSGGTVRAWHRRGRPCSEIGVVLRCGAASHR